jgi:hypothetical protein
MAFTAGLAVLVLLVYYPNGEGAMGDLVHMIWVILAAILTGVSLVKFDPLGLRGKPDDHGTLPGDVSAAVAGDELPAAEPQVVEAVDESDSEQSVGQPLPSGPAPG